MAVVDSGNTGLTYAPTATRGSLTLAYTVSAGAKFMFIAVSASGAPDWSACLVDGQAATEIAVYDSSTMRMQIWAIATGGISPSGNIVVSGPSDPNKSIMSYGTLDEALSPLSPPTIYGSVTFANTVTVPDISGPAILVTVQRSTSAADITGIGTAIAHVDGSPNDLSHNHFYIPPSTPQTINLSTAATWFLITTVPFRTAQLWPRGS